jgi:hypothetical protein
MSRSRAHLPDATRLRYLLVMADSSSATNATEGANAPGGSPVPGLSDLLGLAGVFGTTNPFSGISRSIGQFQRGVGQFLESVEKFNATMDELNGVAVRVNALLDSVEEPVRAFVPQVTRTIRATDALVEQLSGPASRLGPALVELTQRLAPLAQLAESAGGWFGLRPLAALRGGGGSARTIAPQPTAPRDDLDGLGAPVTPQAKPRPQAKAATDAAPKARPSAGSPGKSPQKSVGKSPGKSVGKSPGKSTQKALGKQSATSSAARKASTSTVLPAARRANSTGKSPR